MNWTIGMEKWPICGEIWKCSNNSTWRCSVRTKRSVASWSGSGEIRSLTKLKNKSWCARFRDLRRITRDWLVCTSSSLLRSRPRRSSWARTLGLTSFVSKRKSWMRVKKAGKRWTMTSEARLSPSRQVQQQPNSKRCGKQTTWCRQTVRLWEGEKQIGDSIYPLNLN